MSPTPEGKQDFWFNAERFSQMRPAPTVRVEVEQLKLTMVHELQRYHREIEASVTEQLQTVLQNFDYAKVVERAAAEAIASVVERAVQDAVTRAVQESVEDFFVDGNGREIIAHAIQTRLAKKV